MKYEHLTFGKSQSRVVIIDDFSGRIEQIRTMAAAMAPFPPVENYYPGLRRLIRHTDSDAYDYAKNLLQETAPFIGKAFGMGGFKWLEASFSMVTTSPDSLMPNQRIPHFDSADPGHLALLHYLSSMPGSGTAFYRHRATGIERVTPENQEELVTLFKLESLQESKPGYIFGSDEHFEQIGHVEAKPDRLVIYQGSLLHSGIIPPGMDLSDDPLKGRLTANLFVRGR